MHRYGWPGSAILAAEPWQQRGARALACAQLPTIERWNRSIGHSQGEGTNRLRCRSASFANGNALSIAKELGAVSKLPLELIIEADLAVNFPEINRS